MNAMNARVLPPRFVVSDFLYGLLNPVPYGFFIAGLIFDIIYARTAVVLWGKGAAWLISIGLVFAIVPRVINLVQVWITYRRTVLPSERIDFWLNLLAIIAAIVNAFVHTRDAYSAVPDNVWLSACTVIFLLAARIILVLDRTRDGGISHG